MTAPVAKVTGVRKSYGATRALKGIDLQVHAGEVLGLVGENGSGKSTLLRIWAGVEGPDAGSVAVHGTGIGGAGLKAVTRLGVGIVFQELAFLPNVPLVENFYATVPKLLFRFGIRRQKEALAQCRAILKAYGVLQPAGALTAQVPFGARQLAEIARAIEVPRLVAGPGSTPVVFLDEATTALSWQEVESLATRIRASAEHDQGAYVVVSHRLREVLDICDRIAVLRDGELVNDEPAGALTERDLHQAMTGRALHALHEPSRQARGSPGTDQAGEAMLMETRELTAGQVADVSIRVAPGEVVGVAGIEASGKQDLMQALYGLLKRDAGEVILAGQRLSSIDPAKQLSRGVIYLPKERLAGAVIPSFSIARNVSLMTDLMPVVAQPRAERRAAEEVIADFHVKVRDPHQLVSTLSGGNQQKVALGKWLGRNPRLLLLDNPTRGVDVGAREDIYRALRACVGRGAGVLVASDELEELISICDRIYVMREGRVSAELDLSAGPGTDDAAASSDTLLDHWRRRIVKEMV